ncbi:MAG TPA: hypothetical protein VMW10_01145 [Alphaproteobacteria bacterium]|nr:hypothetical protein [Alphaproteobacteria bacterium]
MLKIRKKKTALAIGVMGLFISFICFVHLDAYDMKLYRSMQDEIRSTERVDLTGLREIQASGGYLPRFPTLARKLRQIKENKVIVNAEDELTQYVKGLPITLLGYGNPAPSLKYYIRRLVFTGTLKERPDLIASEDREAKRYGFIYKNLVIGSRFSVPDQNIDDIVAFFDEYADNSWIHFHCTHGKGRTSMLLAMLDIIKNAPNVALKDIIRRQRLLRSVDLADTVIWLNGGYTKEMLENRKRFIEDFYSFVCQRKAGGIQRWSEWKANTK